MEEQVAEIASLKAQLGSIVRVIKDVGEYKHVVNIRPEDQDIVFKFQLTDAYPTVPPDIVIQSKTLQHEDTEPLKKHLLAKSKTVLNKPMISHLYDEANKWLELQGYHAAIAIDNTPLTSKGKGKKKKPTKKPKEEIIVEKKPSMKTADDVISRIMWDEELQTDCFIVGYLDRFKGIMEKNFTAFSWEDIASVDYNVLAVPRHRIEYFKYKHMKVWDKPSRLDLVFGSTGSKRSITDIIKDYEENPDKYQQPEDVVGVQAELADDDEDDGIEIDTEDTREAGTGSDWTNKNRPNHFLCVRITDAEILEGVIAMEDALLDAQPEYASCCIPPVALHVTICTLGLDTQEQIANACTVLRENKEQLGRLASKGIELEIEGVDHFYKRVLYGKIHVSHEEGNFMEFVDAIKVMLVEGGVVIRDNYDYVPHMTIMKTSRPVSRLLHTKDINPAIYEDFRHMKFGTQVVDGVYLCPMTEERREDGFYNCLESISFELEKVPRAYACPNI